MAEIHNIVKSIQDIMRKDAGVDGDAQRIGQLVWMLFLKIFDDHEEVLKLIDKNYQSPLPEELRWRNWAADPEGITGEALQKFIDEKLFPALKDLEAAADNTQAKVVRSVFADTYNYMKNGTLIRQVVNKINEINFNKQHDRHQFNDFYEKLLKDLQSAGNAGEYYTPRPLTQFIVEMIDPKIGEKVLDPACGTAGFLVSALEYMRGSAKTQKQLAEMYGSLHGTELKQLPHLLAMTNLMLHDVEDPTIIARGDMLGRPLTEYGPKDRVDVIIANPPFGGVVADGTQANFPKKFQTKETALLFLVLFIHLLKDGGRAGVVLPDGALFGEGVAAEIKKELLEKCNVHTIIRLPQGVFNPYAGVNTNLVFFEKGKPTEEVWYYQMELPEGLRQYTKGRPITFAEFEPVKKWWGGSTRAARKASPRAYSVPIADIVARNYNLDFKNPNGSTGAEHKTPKELLADMKKKEAEITNLLAQIKD